MKRVICIVLSLVLVLGLLPVNVLAASFSGSGTQEDPYLIKSADDLMLLASLVNGGSEEYAGAYYKQTANIDLSGYDWKPIGESTSAYFFGSYDGDNYTISNLTSTGGQIIDENMFGGLFGIIYTATINNVHLVNANVNCDALDIIGYFGGLAGLCWGSDVTNCSVRDSYIKGRRSLIANSVPVGGLFGGVFGGSITKCSVTNCTIVGEDRTGALIGEFDLDESWYGFSECPITDCYIADNTITVAILKAIGLNANAGVVCGFFITGDLELTNVYTYNNSITATADHLGAYLYMGEIYGYKYDDCNLIVENGYIYNTTITNESNEEMLTDNSQTGYGRTGDADLSKTADDFADGTVTALLGESFVQGEKYPVLASAANVGHSGNSAGANANVNGGYFVTGEKTHAIIIGGAIITTEHVFNTNGDCIYCRYHVDPVVEEEDIAVEDPVESDEEETEPVPETGIVLAIIPAAVAAAALAISKKR